MFEQAVSRCFPRLKDRLTIYIVLWIGVPSRTNFLEISNMFVILGRISVSQDDRL